VDAPPRITSPATLPTVYDCEQVSGEVRSSGGRLPADEETDEEAHRGGVAWLGGG